MRPDVHVVRERDTLSRIALRYGWQSGQRLYGAQSEAFRQARSDPDLIFPGDRLCVAVSPKQQPAGSGRRHRFERPAPAERLRVRLIDFDWNLPLAEMACVLSPVPQTGHDGEVLSATTDSDGFLDLSLPARWEAIVIEATPKQNPNAAAQEASRGLPSKLTFECRLGAGHAPPAEPGDELEGWTQRLHNLGAYAPAVLAAHPRRDERAALVRLGLLGVTASEVVDLKEEHWAELRARYGR